MKDFRAVSIICRTPSCEAARTPSGQRRLLRQGARLPLSKCSMPALCKCSYEKHDDRRIDDNHRMLGSTQRGAMFGIKARAWKIALPPARSRCRQLQAEVPLA